MPSPRKPSLILPVAVVAVLLATYLGAYYAMAEPLGVGGDSRAVFYCRPGAADPWGDWRFNERVTPWFSRLHWLDRRIRAWVWEPGDWLDRRIRPHVWEPTP